MTRRRHRSFRVVRVSGGPEERGRQYGQQARDLIRDAVAGYAAVFRHYADWDWNTVRAHAGRYENLIAEFAPSSAREMAGIADGAGVEVADILALNTRSEIMFAAPPTGGMSLPTECSSFAVLADRTDTARLLAGQNWDWIEQVRATTVVLDVTRSDAPNFVTIVEAGLLAKVGVNSVGVGLCTNTLISDRDEGRLAVPYHVLLRSVLDSEHGQDAMHRVQQASRANSGNYLIVDDRGFCQDLETTPTESAVLTPHQGALVHANHFLTPGLADEDRYLQRKHHTIARFDNLSASLAGSSQLSEADLRRALADHSDAPSSVCQHPNPDLPVAERTCTVAGVILDPEERTLSYCAGNPCEAPWTTHDVRP